MNVNPDICKQTGPHNDGAPNDGTPNDGTPNDGAPNDGAPNDGPPNDGAPSDGAPNDEAPNDDFNNDEMDNKEYEYFNHQEDSDDNEDIYINFPEMPYNQHLTKGYTVCDEYIPATANAPGFLRFDDMWFEEVPAIVMNKETGETYRLPEPINCRTGVISVHTEYSNPPEFESVSGPTPTNPVTRPKKKKVVKKQSRNPFKKFKRM